MHFYFDFCGFFLHFSANPHVIVPGGRMPFLKLQQLIGLQSFPAAYWYFTGGMIPQPTSKISRYYSQPSVPQAFIEELVNQWNQIPNDILGAVALEMVTLRNVSHMTSEGEWVAASPYLLLQPLDTGLTVGTGCQLLELKKVQQCQPRTKISR